MSRTSKRKKARISSSRDRDAKPWEDVTLALQHGDQARSENDSGGAFAFYARATELDPNNVEAWLGRGATAPTMDDAIASWVHALSLSPSNDEAKRRLQQRIEEMIASANPTDAQAFLDMGRILAEAGQKDYAYPLLQRATELDDTNEEAWIWRAGVSQDNAEKIACLNQALALNPGSVQAQAGLQSIIFQEPQTSRPVTQERVAEAARLVEQAQQLVQSHDREGAHRLFQQATELDQRNEQAWLWRGSTTKDVDEALTCMEQALLINPQNESAREARSWLRVKKLRDRVGTLPSDGESDQSTAESSGPVKRSIANTLFLLVTPIIVIILGLAVLIWKLF